jgi:hypothetical protein
MESLEMKETKNGRVQGGCSRGAKIETGFAGSELKYYKQVLDNQADAIRIELEMLRIRKADAIPEYKDYVSQLNELQNLCKLAMKLKF